MTNNFDFDREEQELIKSFENNEWKSDNTPKRLKELQFYIKNTLEQNEEITLSLSTSDLESLQTKAMEDGISSQTLIASILHKYVTGRLIEKT
jgi:predicted DNA binding CopG/RHH family protein